MGKVISKKFNTKKQILNYIENIIDEALDFEVFDVNNNDDDIDVGIIDIEIHGSDVDESYEFYVVQKD